ncbi:methylated-DNA--[protein]-cysteine S-methyltransferase [uncultured Bacteroides sp.]|uniref:methylated-DNA--[protein]-cysteine S-methyltransferase n=1 Tax=uncultured Bacteroides sp. TaxID=162156 RepID=UPI002620D657|nr:methylated-DNA--[protein]-cysteine S-methyltransferase [uncultured Bacteroides sp.]
MYAFTYQTPIGELVLYEENGFLIGVTTEPLQGNVEIKETGLMKETYRQLEEYFAGKRKVFDLPLDMRGTTFQKQVWMALQQIPYGETRSYKQIAEAIGNSKAVRAVGMANHENPFIIIVPCHRVIGTNGKLTGYAAGLDIKRYLLNLEKGEKGLFDDLFDE